LTEYLTRKQLAGILQCSEDAIRLWEKEGRIRSERFGRLVRIHRTELEYLQRNGGLRQTGKLSRPSLAEPDDGIDETAQRSIN
jgi:excisionase family DNA binding protein